MDRCADFADALAFNDDDGVRADGGAFAVDQAAAADGGEFGLGGEQKAGGEEQDSGAHGDDLLGRGDRITGARAFQACEKGAVAVEHVVERVAVGDVY